MTNLKNLREKLDHVDEEFIALVAKRMELVHEISKVKAGQSDLLRDSEREREVLSRVEKAAQTRNLSIPFAKKLFREILSYSLEEQSKEIEKKKKAPGTRRITVAFQGIENAYSHLAAQSYFARDGDGLHYVGNPTFKSAMASLVSGAVDYAILPLENTTAGSINEVYDLLLENDVSIVGEEIWKVEHCLIGTEEVPLEKIRKIISHPQAIEQCSNFLSSLRSVNLEGYFDTAGAVKKIAEDQDPEQAAIASAESAQAWGLSVLKRTITNQEENFTRFVILSRNPVAYDVRIPCKTSLILSTRHEKGALVNCLKILSNHELNMTKLESRPRGHRPWEYLFYLDFQGNLSDPKTSKALDELKGHSLYLKVLGTYPAKAFPMEAAVTSASGQEFPLVAEEEPPLEPVSSPKPEKALSPVLIKSKDYKLVSRNHQPEDTLIRVGDLLIGKQGFVIMAGPCAVESENQILQTAQHVKKCGGQILRGGVFKPRTSPYSFQGMGWEGLTLLYEAGKQYGLPIVTEVLAPEQVKGVSGKADILQIGARNMQNFPLLREVGKVNRPVLLKRGMSSTLEELLAAAEYILSQGNGQVMLCERGIRTFETSTRNTLDLSAVPVLSERTHLPIIVDPSHGTGHRRYVPPMSLAAKAVGAHGLLIEIHPDPDKALSDGPQSLTLQDFSVLMKRLRKG